MFFPSSSNQTFSSRPTIMNGFARARLRLELQSRMAAARDSLATRWTGIVAFSRIEPAIDAPVSLGGDYAGSRVVASAKNAYDPEIRSPDEALAKSGAFDMKESRIARS